MAVLILSDPNDEHARHMYGVLSSHPDCDQCLMMNSQDFPGHMKLSMNSDEIGVSGSIRLSEQTVSWHAIQSIYWRQYSGTGMDAISDLPNMAQAELADNDARSLMESFLIHLKHAGCQWVNGYDGYRLHQTKPVAFMRVKECLHQSGLASVIKLPRTLWSNDPETVLKFVQASKDEGIKELIFKPVQGGAHTAPLTAEMLSAAHMENLKYAPVTIQEKVTGDDIRVFVAGNQVAACEILTDALDFRDDDTPTLRPVNLPEPIEKASIHIARSLHLIWTGIDLRRTGTGDYYFFEANPSPMFLGFESATGLPLTQMLTDCLLNHA